MSFHQSAQDVRVDEGHLLRGKLRNENGDMVDAELDLNNCLGNTDGRFEWGGSGFSNSAQNISFNMEGDASVLRAELNNTQGQFVPADVNLSERLVNQNGQFVFT